MDEAMAAERWAPTPGHPGYEVSDLGRARSLDRVLINRLGHHCRYRGQPLRTWPERGYLMVRLGEGRQYAVHRLVLEAFVGSCPPGLECLHGNGDRTDARLANLRWGTHVENAQDMIRHGRHPMARKTHCPRRHPLAGDNLNPAHAKTGDRHCRACTKAYARIKWCRRNGFVPPNYQEESDRQYAAILAGHLDGRAGRRITKWLPVEQRPRRVS